LIAPDGELLRNAVAVIFLALIFASPSLGILAIGGILQLLGPVRGNNLPLEVVASSGMVAALVEEIFNGD